MPALKQTLRNRILTIGSWLTFPSEAPAEIMAQAGCEWLVIDMEHAPLTVADAARLIRVIDLAGLPALCRLPANDPAIAKCVLDAGAAGVIVPNIETAAAARRAVDAVFYPPRGRRGVGLARAQGYGSGLETYRRHRQDSLVVIAMIESQAGVGAASAIAATSGLDALFIGPYDLSASLGYIGQLSHPDVQAAERQVRDIARKADIACGLHVVHPSAAALQTAIRDGYTFIALGVDMIFLGEAAKTAMGWISARPRRLQDHRVSMPRVGAQVQEGR